MYLGEFTIISTSCAKGVHSIERSAQEDMLLVLFNAAISNLVCRLLHFDIGFLPYHCHRFSFVTTSLLVATSVVSFGLSSPARLY